MKYITMTDGQRLIELASRALPNVTGWRTAAPTASQFFPLRCLKCERQDWNLHTMLSDGVATVRQSLGRGFEVKSRGGATV